MYYYKGGVMPRYLFAIFLMLTIFSQDALGYMSKGDMDNDGQITINDVLTVLRMAIGVYSAIPATGDPTGTATVLSLVPLENFRTATNVNFSISLAIKNTGSVRVNFGVAFSAKNSNGVAVFSRTINGAVNPGETYHTTASYGEPLTIDQFDGISRWEINSFTVYQ